MDGEEDVFSHTLEETKLIERLRPGWNPDRQNSRD